MKHSLQPTLLLENVDGAYDSISNTIVHEIGHILAFNRIHIHPALIGLDERGLSGFTSFIQYKNISSEALELGSAGGILFENAVFGRYKVHKAQDDLIAISNNNKEYSAFDSNNIESGKEFAEKLQRKYMNTFPTKHETLRGIEMYEFINSNMLKWRRVKNYPLISGWSLLRYLGIPRTLFELKFHRLVALGKMDDQVVEIICARAEKWK